MWLCCQMNFYSIYTIVFRLSHYRLHFLPILSTLFYIVHSKKVASITLCFKSYMDHLKLILHTPVLFSRYTLVYCIINSLLRLLKINTTKNSIFLNCTYNIERHQSILTLECIIDISAFILPLANH